MPQRFFEDFAVGDRFETEAQSLSEEEIIDFASRYDPQYLHIDAEAAKASIYGGLIASGWHTMALGFRLFIDLDILGRNSLGSPGIDELRWLKPVRPGDTIRTRAEVVATRPSRSRPERGNVHFSWTILNQRDEAVTTFKSVQIMRRRG